MTKPVPAAARPGEAAFLLIAPMVAIYAISQFLRNSIGVIAGDITRELGLSATQTGLLSSAFFLAFALAQIPVGIAIDRYGPKRTMMATAVLAVIGTVLFALAPSAGSLIASRALMGLGCSTFFMAPLVIYARRFPPQRFPVLTSLQMGLANIGTLCATAPLALSSAAFGWRPSFLAVAGLTVLVAVVIALAVPGDSDQAKGRESWAEALRGVAAAVRVPSFAPVFFLQLTAYSSFATVVGLWGGPWLADVHGADPATKGNILLAGASAQMAGLLLWGAMDRYWGSFRRPILIGGCVVAALLVLVAALPIGLAAATLWFAVFGLCIGFTPILTAHGKSLFPAHLTGRGITLMNIGTIGGAFLSQSVTGLLMDLVGRSPDGLYRPEGYRLVFAALAVWLALSLAFYARAIDPHPSRHATKS